MYYHQIQGTVHKYTPIPADANIFLFYLAKILLKSFPPPSQNNDHKYSQTTWSKIKQCQFNFSNFLFYIGVQSINNAVIVPTCQFNFMNCLEQQLPYISMPKVQLSVFTVSCNRPRGFTDSRRSLAKSQWHSLWK